MYDIIIVMLIVVRGMCDGITFVDKLISNVLYKGKYCNSSMSGSFAGSRFNTINIIVSLLLCID